MDLKAGLFQQQSLKLVMTKELTQAITLLQYSSLELHEFLTQQSLENPLIEMKDTFYRRVGKKDKHPIDYMANNPLTLAQHLRLQMIFLHLEQDEEHAIEYIIDLLDENGYLPFGVEEISSELGIDSSIIEKVVSLIQELEPFGIGARNLQECLMIQLVHLEKRNHLAEKVIADYFQLFAKKAWKDIAKALAVRLQDIQEVHDLIMTLDPRPGSRFNHQSNSFITPDVKVEFNHGEFKITILDYTSSRLSLNTQYLELKNKNQEASSYLDEKYYQYKWIVKSLEHRKETIVRVMSEIVRNQPLFFQLGPDYLEPLTMKEVADALELHESTVSRASKGKYVQTPFGTFEIKSFFTTQIQSNKGSEVSSVQAKSIISDIIEKEDKLKPLSDQKIVEKLEKEHGIMISRRTVAKYREQLGIQSSSIRKRY